MTVTTSTRFDNPEFGLTVIGYIDSGSFGNTYLCKNNDRYYVLKVAKEKDDQAKERFKKEGLYIRKYGSNISLHVLNISCVDDGFDLLEGEFPFLIMDYIPGITLHQLLEALRGENAEHPNNFKKLIKYKIIYGIARGIYLLHKKGVIHRDIKPGNIFIDQDFNPHIGDFGDLRDNGPSTNVHGTDCFLPPEALPKNEEGEDNLIPCGPKYDVFEFGGTLFQIITYEWPFNDKDTRLVLENYTSQGKRDDRVERGEISILEEDKPLYEIVKMCWDQNPDERPSMKTVSAWIYTGAKDILGDEYDEFKKYADSIGKKSGCTGSSENVIKAITNGFAAYSDALKIIAGREGIEVSTFENTIRSISDGSVRPPTTSTRAFPV